MIVNILFDHLSLLFQSGNIICGSYIFMVMYCRSSMCQCLSVLMINKLSGDVQCGPDDPLGGCCSVQLLHAETRPGVLHLPLCRPVKVNRTHTDKYQIISFSAARLLANVSPQKYLQMNHKQGGYVSVLVLWCAPVMAYVTTHNVCGYKQFCPSENVKVK